MLTVVAYDIPDDKRRLRAANALEDFGDRVQKSVFECLLEEKEIEHMIRRLNRIIDTAEDSVRIYRLCSACQRKVHIMGRGKPTELPDAYII